MFVKKAESSRLKWLEKRNVNEKIDFDLGIDIQKFQSCSGDFADSNFQHSFNFLESSNLETSHANWTPIKSSQRRKPVPMLNSSCKSWTTLPNPFSCRLKHVQEPSDMYATVSNELWCKSGQTSDLSEPEPCPDLFFSDYSALQFSTQDPSI